MYKRAICVRNCYHSNSVYYSIFQCACMACMLAYEVNVIGKTVQKHYINGTSQLHC